MPVYVASRPLQSLAGLAAEHQYLVYVPAGEEDNYSTWKTIGAFPAGTGLDGLGSGSLLVGSSGGVSTIGVPLDQTPDNWSNSAVDDYRAEFPNYTDVEIGENLFHFTEIYSGIDESTVWDGLVSIANGLDGDYTYKVIDVYGATNNVVFGPTTNSNSFVSSVLRLAAIDGYSISEFTTSAITPGYATLLGTSNNDTLSATDANIDGGDFAAIYGGDGADVLTGGSSSIYLIGGKDDQVDILTAGSGNTTLVGYYNLNDLNHSDSFHGGAGNDTFVVIDRTTALAGGIPDIENAPESPGTSFLQNGEITTAGSVIAGGSGNDTLTYCCDPR